MMAAKDLRVNLTIDSKGAVAGLENVADAADKADKAVEAVSDEEISLSVDKAIGNVDEVIARTKKLFNTADQKLVLEADVNRAKASIENINDRLKEAHKLSDEEISVLLRVRDEATKRIDKVQDELDHLEKSDVEVKVDADTSGAESALDSLGGKFGDIKNLLTSPVGATIGIGAALFEAANNAAEAGQEIQQIADLLGTSTENASRMRSAFSGVGVETNDLLDIALQVNGVLTDNKEVASQLGITIGKDVAQNFLNAAAAAEKIPDPVERARLQSNLFGEEGVRQVSRITSEFGSLEKAMEGVSETQVLSQQDLDNLKKYRESMRELKASMQDVATEIGTGVAPALTSLTGAVADFITEATKAGKAVEDFGERNRSMLGVLGDALGKFTGAGWKDYKKDTDEAAESTRGMGRRAEEMGTAQTAMASSMESASTEIQHQIDLHTELAEKSQAAADAVRDQIDAQFALADSGVAAAEAQDEWNVAVLSYGKAMKDAKGNQIEMNEVTRDATDKAVALANSYSRVQADLLSANGQTQTATQKIDSFNTSMLKSASTASGPLKQSIINYIATVNGIPPEKVSKILADLQEGTVTDANAELQKVSRTRNASIKADADTAAAEAELRAVANKKYIAKIQGVWAGMGGSFSGKVVGPGFSSNAYLPPWNAEGPTATPRVGATAAATAVLPANTGATGGRATSNQTTNVTIHMPVGSTPEQTVGLINRYQRRNGKGASSVPRAPS